MIKSSTGIMKKKKSLRIDESRLDTYDTASFYHYDEFKNNKSRRVLAPYLNIRTVAKKESPENRLYNVMHVEQKPSILVRDLSQILSENIDISKVLLETVETIAYATESLAGIIYMVDNSTSELILITKDMGDEQRLTYKIQKGTTVQSFCASSKEWVRADDIISDNRFPEGLGISDLKVKAVIGLPIVTPDNECVAVFILYRQLSESPYTDQELELAVILATWVGSAIFQNHQRVGLEKQHELNRNLLQMSKCYFSETVLLDKLIAEFCNFAKITVHAEHGNFFILKPTHDVLFADYYEETELDSEIYVKKSVKIKTDSEFQLIHMCATKGVLINISNATLDGRVIQTKTRPYLIRSVILIPVMCGNNVLGILQLMNRVKGDGFNNYDLELLQSFLANCSFILSYHNLFKLMTSTHGYNNIYLDMITHHMLPCSHDITHLTNYPIVTSLPPKFNSFDFCISETYEHYQPQLINFMFREVAPNTFPNLETMINFILIIKKCYNEKNVYHNFAHAFNVCHAMYSILKRNMDIFDIVERKALLMAAYCHDIHHCGLSNHFLEATKHHLSQLYDYSPRENHHYHATVFIIKHLDIFGHLPREEFKKIIFEIRRAILATDIGSYFRRRRYLYRICAENIFDWDDCKHRTLLKSIMMNAADMSGLCKPFTVGRKVTTALFHQFYAEGDKYKRFNFCALPMMNRGRKTKLPEDQINFLSVIVLPCMLILTRILPNCVPLYREALKVREGWQEVIDAEGKKLWVPDPSFTAMHLRV